MTNESYYTNNNTSIYVNQGSDDTSSYDEKSSSSSHHDDSIVDTMTITMACSISFVLLCIAGAIFIWFLRDCREYIEENKDREQTKKDEEEAEKNKKNVEKRKRAIDATIQTQKLHVENDNDNCTESITSSFMSSQGDEIDDLPSERTHTTNESAIDKSTEINDNIDDDDDDNIDENICSICLEPFYNNEELSWSKGNKCQHVFHSECLIPWLMKHEECPVCRTEFMTTHDFLDRNYVVDEEVEDKDEEEQGSEVVVEDDGESDIDDDDGDAHVTDNTQVEQSNDNQEISSASQCDDQRNTATSLTATANTDCHVDDDDDFDEDDDDDEITNLEEGRLLNETNQQKNYDTNQEKWKGCSDDHDQDDNVDMKNGIKVVSGLVSTKKKRHERGIYEKASSIDVEV